VTVTVNFKPTGGMEVTPSDVFASSGPDRDDHFDPPSKTYAVRNGSKSPIDFQVAKTADWLDLSPTSGTIPPDASVTVKASIIAEKAKTLRGNTYKDTLAFTNTTNGKGNTARAVELTVGEEQTWQITVNGWETNRMPWSGLVLKDNKTGKTTNIIKAVKFDWALTGKFRIRKEEGRWVYKDGSVTAASCLPSEDTQPKGLYDCSMGACQGKAQIGSYAGQLIVGNVSGGAVQLRWRPFSPSTCVSCKPLHPDLPKSLYEAMFESHDFINRISAESYQLVDRTYPAHTEKDWLYYVVSLKRLK
jgi:hypothetical protein